MLHIGIISLFPDMIAGLKHSIIGRAISQNRVTVDVWNPRDWAAPPHHQVDDKPYGGGPGMVMMYEPLAKALEHAKRQMPEHCKTVYLSPQGKRLKQHDVNEMASQKQPLLFLAGRYEGIDERVIQHHVDEEWSLGDFVISGGELAAMVFIDAMVRLLPGALGDDASAAQDSFMEGLLDYPHYTRPANIAGKAVPSVLLSGHHGDIAQWRRKQALGNTWLKRPDLLEDIILDETDKQLLDAFKREQQNS